MINKGVRMHRLNPKSIDTELLFGAYDREVRTWKEGVFTQVFRECSNDTSSKRKWIHLDGGIDSGWVENLNSILDDNRKMSLPSGESIMLSQHTSILLESDTVEHATPATISRCALLYLEQDVCVRPKYLFNAWLRGLPPNLLQDGAGQDIENLSNFLLSIAFEVYDLAKQRGHLLTCYSDHYSLVWTFLKILDSLLQDFRTYGQKIVEAKSGQSDGAATLTQLMKSPRRQQTLGAQRLQTVQAMQQTH